MSVEKHLPGPWMCFVAVQNEYADFRVMTHIETAICIDARRWESADDIITDDYGYNQPNGLCDVPPVKVATARLIAAAPDLLRQLGTLYAMTIHAKEQAGEVLTEDEEILKEDVNAALAKALGVSPTTQKEQS